MNAKKAKHIRQSIRRAVPDVETLNTSKSQDGSVRHNPATFKGLMRRAKKVANASR